MPVEKEKIQQIIEAGRFTQTSTNSQDVSYTVVTDKLDELNIKEVNSKLEDILAKHLGVEKVTLIQCGGGD